MFPIEDDSMCFCFGDGAAFLISEDVHFHQTKEAPGCTGWVKNSDVTDFFVIRNSLKSRTSNRTWRIIPFSKWLVSPLTGVILFQMA